MSLGVNLLAVLVERAARALGPAWDAEIVEMHHRLKVDAPSGTALLLGEAAARGRGVNLSEHSARGRDGLTGPRKAGDIGFASLRGGTVIGDHSVIFAGVGERIEFSHRAEDRGVFARGALAAALWTRGRARRVFIRWPTCSVFPMADRHKGLANMNRTLVLVRHGESEWNAKNLFTGWKNPDLTPLGVEEARRAGQELRRRDILFSIGFTSALLRARHTIDLIFEELGQSNVPIVRDRALNERHYGDLSGLNKDEARDKWGEEQVRLWRRSYDVAPPGGESLKDTVARVVPFYCQRILPPVLRGERVLVAAHGNSLRALAMVLDQMTPESVTTLEFATGAVVIYTLNADSTVASKDVVECAIPSSMPVAPR